MTHNFNNSQFPRSQSEDFASTNQPRILPHNSRHSMESPGSGSFRRTLESARQFSFSNVIREIEPLVETARNVNAEVQNAISMTSFLNRSPSEQNLTNPISNNVQDNNSFVIVLDENPSPPVNVEHDNVHANYLNNSNNPPNNNAEEANVDIEQTLVQLHAQEFLRGVLFYLPFVLILLLKAVYDYHQGIFIIIILFCTFTHSNSVVKKEATNRERRSLSVLAIELLYITVCLIFVYYCYRDDFHKVILNLIYIRPFTTPLTVASLIWIMTITDFILKLLTITIKILLTMLPDFVVPFKKRGKLYLTIEAVSQLYRSIATIQPCLYYLLESYEGPEKIVAVFLSAFYMISKGNYLMSKVKLLKSACMKLIQNVSIGSSPSKDQIQTAGEHCPICHDEYESPVLLQCRHIFCETCVSIWFDREQTCPLCRAKIVDDPSWRDGSTSYFIQLF